MVSGADFTSTTNTFVGRERELAELVSACESGADSDAHLFLIHGESGIGKTRLADELGARAKALGLQVLWGRCWEGDGAPAYWPWIQVIRTFLGAVDPEQRSNLASYSGIASDVTYEVAQIIPDLRPAESALHPLANAKLEPSEARFRLFDAVTNFLKIGARSHPMLIVLDDLHDADEASLALLRFTGRELKGAPITIVATYRDIEMRRSRSLSKLIGKLSREARSIPMSGLSESEVATLIELRAGQRPDEALVSKLCAATNGNPLFVDGIVRNLIAERAIGSARALDLPLKIPSGVREAIRDHLDRLAPNLSPILAAAAAIGNEFGFDLCQSVANVSDDEAHRLLDEAAGAGIVTALGYGRYRFSHALIRNAVYDELDTNRRVGIHGRIANRIEEIYSGDIEAHLAELAHHFRYAGMIEKATAYSVRAGKAAASVSAFTDAMMHLQTALELMGQHDSDPLQRADLLSLLGTTAFEVDRAAAVKYGESAIELYEKLGRFDLAARVHTLLGMIFHMRGEPLSNAALATDHLRRAELAMAKEPESSVLALLYCVVSANEFAKLNFVESESAARRAMEISESLGDKMNWPWAAANYAWCLCMRGQLSDGFALLERAFESALQAKISTYTVTWRAGLFSKLLGDPKGAQLWFERELKRRRKAASPLAFEFFSTWIDYACFDEGQVTKIGERYDSLHPGLRFWIGGRWEDAAKALENLVELCDRSDNQIFSLSECLLAGLANLFIGERLRAEALFRYGLENGDRGPVPLLEMRARPRLAQLYVEMNQLDEAAEQVARCQQILAMGEDWRGLAGGVARAKALVESSRRNYGAACKEFESATVIHRKYHLVWEEAETLHFWGRALAAAGELTRAAEKFDAAIEIYRSRGTAQRFVEHVMVDRMRALEPTPTGTDIGGAQHLDSTQSTVTGTFRREGAFWTISYGGTSLRLKNAKGLHYIAYLLGRPGQRAHVHDLIEAIDGSAASPRTTVHAESERLEIVREIDGPGPTLDPRARSEYRARLRDVRAELDEAERMSDLGRCERLRAEIEIVGQQLTGSLGGRARTASVSAERARGLVGKGIRSVVKNIRDQHPGLGRHFASAISTGYFCAYQPEAEHPISWQL